MNEAHQAIANFYHANSAREIFGPHMTTLTIHMLRCLSKRFKPGDEIVLSRMDHDANVAPWLLLAENRGLTVRWMDFDPGSSRIMGEHECEKITAVRVEPSTD